MEIVLGENKFQNIYEAVIGWLDQTWSKTLQCFPSSLDALPIGYVGVAGGNIKGNQKTIIW